MSRAKVRPTHNYGGHAAGTVLELDDAEIDRLPDVLEHYTPERPRPQKPTREELFAMGCPESELERALAHELLDHAHGWGRYRELPPGHQDLIDALGRGEGKLEPVRHREGDPRAGKGEQLEPRTRSEDDITHLDLPPASTAKPVAEPDPNSPELLEQAKYEEADAAKAAEQSPAPDPFDDSPTPVSKGGGKSSSKKPDKK